MEAPLTNFETIKQTNQYGIEYWSARDLAPILGYNKWQNFDITIQRAMNACELTGQEVSKHFFHTTKYIVSGHGAKRGIKDFYFTRFALHLILIYSDIKKPQILQALAYFTLISLERNTNYFEMARELGISIPKDIETTKEQKTIGQIVSAFKHLRTVRQYKVSPYYIDLYFQDYKIAVECDECGHRRYSSDIEYRRQSYIEGILNCIFIRYNPDALDFNIGDVIYQIIELVYEK